jgi:hypothetical protein
VNEGVLTYPLQVLGELERFSDKSKADLPYDWAKRNEARATRFSVLLNEVKQVLAVVPKILDPDKTGVEEADPYVLALAMYLRNSDPELKVTVLTEERKDRPDKMSMTTACGVLELICLPIITFLELQGIWP